MSKKLISVLMLGMVLLSACAAPAPALEYKEPCTPQNASAQAPGNLNLIIGTGGTGGVFYPYGVGLAELLTEKLPNASVSVQETGGSVDNMKLIQSGGAALGMSTVDSAYNALNGVDTYAETGKIPACAIAVLYTSFLHIVALKESDINNIADMKGKRVSVGAAGSSTEGLADRVLQAAGLNPQTDIIRSGLNLADTVAAMQSKEIDAFFWIGGLPTPAISELADTPDLGIQFLDASEFVKSLTEKYGPVYSTYTLPAGVYTSQTTDVNGIGIGNILFVNANMNEQLVYDALAIIFDNLDKVHTFHAESARLSLNAAVSGSSIPFHPGALRFYTERGVLK